jgi:hypothetical protein
MSEERTVIWNIGSRTSEGVIRYYVESVNGNKYDQAQNKEGFRCEGDAAAHLNNYLAPKPGL